MKNIYKLLFLVVLFTVVSCENEDDPRFQPNTETGWVEFTSAATTTGQTSSMVSIPLSIRVPVYPNGIEIAYSITSIEGDFTQFVSGSSGVISVDPENENRVTSLDIPLANMEVGRGFSTSFEITLQSVTPSSVTLGLDENAVTVHTVTIPCSNPDILPATYFVGDYMLEDVEARIGPGNGTTNFSPGVVTVSLGANPNDRVFSSPLLGGFRPNPVEITITFSPDDYVGLGGTFGPSPGISCGGPAYVYAPAAAADSTPWDICNDQAITIVYTEDPDVSCGGPFAASFSLTKQ